MVASLPDMFTSGIETYSYLGIFIVMIVNGVVSFPSSQIVYLATGFFVGSGTLVFIPSVIAGALGNTIGNIILFMITRKYGERVARKFLPIDQKVFEALTRTFSHKGVWWLFIGKLVPSLKVVVPIVAGLTRISLPRYTMLMLTASLVWAAFFIGMGMLFGEQFRFDVYGIIVAIIAIIVVSFLYTLIQKEMNKEEIKS